MQLARARQNTSQQMMQLPAAPVRPHALLAEGDGADDDVVVEDGTHGGGGVEGTAGIEIIHENRAKQGPPQPLPHLADLHNVHERGAVLGVAGHYVRVKRRAREELTDRR
jgi:hypothetical protein